MWKTTPSIPTPDISHLRPIAVDTETFLIAPGRQAPPLVCVSFCEPGHNPVLQDADEGSATVAALLADPTIMLVFLNAPFDLLVLVNHGVVTMASVVEALLANRIMDIGVWQRLHHIRRGWLDYSPKLNKVTPVFSLEECALYWLGETVKGKGADSWRLRYAELKHIPIEDWPEEAKRYAADDAAYTIRVWQRQYECDGLLPDVLATVRKNMALAASTANGVRTDSWAVDLLEYKLLRDTEETQQELYEAGYYKIKKEKGQYKLSMNKAFVEETCKAAYESRGMPCPLTDGGKDKLEEKKKPSTSAESLAGSQHPDLMAIAEISGDRKLLNTYIPLLRQGATWPICPRYTPAVATGRTSSYAPNIQNQPRKGGVRECFVPRKGKVFVGCDYNIAELRSLSQVLLNLFGHSKMAEVILSGKDIHAFVGTEYLRTNEPGCENLTYEEFEQRRKSGDTLMKDTRQMMKGLNFGVPGGLGAASLVEYVHASYGVEMTLDKAAELIAFFKNTFPEMQQYFSMMARYTRNKQTFQLTQFGSMRERGDVGYCDGCNSYFQGLTADGALYAVWNVFVEMYLGVCWDNPTKTSPLYGSRMIAFVHDEIILESPASRARACAKRLSEVMCGSMDIYTPDVPAIAEAHLMRRWYKDAEPVYRCDDCGAEGGSETCKKCGGHSGLVPWYPSHPAGKLKKAPKTPEMDAMLQAKGMYDPRRSWEQADVMWLKTEEDLEPGVPPKKRIDWEWLHDCWQLEQRARETNPDQWC